MSEWTAYCAPGRKMISALALALGGEDVDEIIETQMLEGRTDITLVNRAAITDVLELPLSAAAFDVR